MSTRRTYILLSDACALPIPAFEDPGENHAAHCAWAQTVTNIADALARQSTAFDRERFLKDAGVA